MNSRILTTLCLLLSSAMSAVAGVPGPAPLHVLPPVTHGNLTIFPVVGGPDHDTSRFLTLDEGVQAGTVVVTERGSLQGLIRPGTPVHQQSGAEVNRLVLINNSDRPLLLLAGEIVTGGKQDRVIGADRLVPPKSEPIDLSVFCVEPGRWVASSEHFGSLKLQMAQPSVRTPAMAAHNQQEVWDMVGSAKRALATASPAPLAGQLEGTTSYAKAMASPQVQERLDLVASDYESILRELRKSDAKGVVVAINGNIVWADLFASSDLLAKYWQKLIRSYAAESLTSVNAKGMVDQKTAQEFLDRLSGNREVIETEPGVYRRAEVTGHGYKVFTLTALTSKPDFDLHIAKMAYDVEARQQIRPAILVR
ncbi:MAG: DUF6569 family protein [Candidatus Korobacteraceae bacterium]